jgi:hypothetical protein
MKTSNAKAYLNSYYQTMDAENTAIVNFLRFIPNQHGSLLDYGCGASIMVSASVYDRYTDLNYTDADVRLALEMFRFKLGIPSFNWHVVLNHLQIKKKELRKKIKHIYLSRLPASLPTTYDTITSFFCLDMASKNWREFNLYYKSLMDHVREDGWLIVGLVTDRCGAVPGENDYQCLNIKRDTFLKYHKPTIFETISACDNRGYKGMLFSAEHKNNSI